MFDPPILVFNDHPGWPDLRYKGVVWSEAKGIELSSRWRHWCLYTPATGEMVYVEGGVIVRAQASMYHIARMRISVPLADWRKYVFCRPPPLCT